MPRRNRAWIAEEVGAYHLISRVSKGEYLFGFEEKEYFFKLVQRYAKGFYVDIHAFCIMSNHFHILATGSESQAEKASGRELVRRYRAIHGSDKEIPEGSYSGKGELEYDPDGGIERLRKRLGSISRFMQEIKQTFSRWYNKKNNVKGCLWGDRFKGVLVAKGESLLACAAYIDLNPVRAGLVKNPEDYRFSSMGLKVRKPRTYKALITRFRVPGVSLLKFPAFYRQFVFEAGGIKQENKAAIPKDIVEKVQQCKGRLQLGEKLRHRFANFSEGIAIGSHDFIAGLQKEMGRKRIKPRSISEGEVRPENLFSTRVIGALLQVVKR